MEPGPDRSVDASDVLRYAQSPFSLYCDAFADDASRDPPDPAVDVMTNRARAHKEKILEEMYPDASPVMAPTIQKAFGMALCMMADGAHAVMECPLFHMPSGMTATPIILERRNGDSAFGNHHYVATQIERVMEPTKHHLLRAAFCSLAIGCIQERSPDEFQIVDAAGKIRQFRFAGLRDDLVAAVSGIRKVLAGKVPPAVFGTGLYPWKVHNDRIARELRDISLVSGVGADTRSKLASAGMQTVDDMLHAAPDRLQAIYGIGNKKAASYMASAKALATGKPVQKGPRPKLPAERTNMFLDLQGTDIIGDENPMDYLLGVLVRQDGQEEYFSFAAHSRDDEKLICHDFLKLIRGYQSGAIYHWNAYEAVHLKRLLDRHGYSQNILAKCLLYDLRRMAVSAYAFPVPGTGLRKLSEWMEYEWESPDVEPAASALLYGEYMRNPNTNASVLDDVLKRSRDKCAALATVWDWLVNGHAGVVVP